MNISSVSGLIRWSIRPSIWSFIKQAGPAQVVLGTDFPFDMGVDDPISRLDAIASLDDADRAAIRGGNAAKLLGL